MAKRWFQSVDLEIDDQGRPVFETALQAIQVASAAIQESAEALAGLIDAAELRVKLSTPIEADIVQADMEQITGVPPLDRDLYDLWSLLGSPAQAGEAADAAATITAPLTGQSFVTVADCLQSDGFGGANPSTAYGKLAFILDALTNPTVMGSVAESTYNSAWTLSYIEGILNGAYRDGSGWGENSSIRVVSGEGAGAEKVATEYTLGQVANALLGGPYNSTLANMLIGSWQPSSNYQGDMEPGDMLASGLFGGPNSTSVARKLTAYSPYVMDVDLGDFLAEALCTSGSGTRIADLLFNGYASASVADLLFDGSNSVAQLLSRGPGSGYTISRLLEDVAVGISDLGGWFYPGGFTGPSGQWNVATLVERILSDGLRMRVYDGEGLRDPQLDLFGNLEVRAALGGGFGTYTLSVDDASARLLVSDAGLSEGSLLSNLLSDTGDAQGAYLANVANRLLNGFGTCVADLLTTVGGIHIADLLYHPDLSMPVSYLLGNAAGGVADHVYAGLRSAWSGVWLPDMLEAPDGATAISVLKDLGDDSAFRRDGAYADWTTLSAPGVTADESFDYALSDHTLQVKVNNINTDVTVRLEGSIDETGWFPLAADLTITANGTYAIFASGRPVYYVRGNFVSETGGADATVKLVYQGLR